MDVWAGVWRAEINLLYRKYRLKEKHISSGLQVHAPPHHPTLCERVRDSLRRGEVVPCEPSRLCIRVVPPVDSPWAPGYTQVRAGSEGLGGDHKSHPSPHPPPLPLSPLCSALQPRGQSPCAEASDCQLTSPQTRAGTDLKADDNR